MPFTPEIITANEALKTLTAEQVAAVVQLGENVLKVDLKKEVDTHTGEIYRRLDEDVKSVTGREKPEGVKTYNFVKEVLGEYKTAAEKASGGDSEELRKAKADLDDLKKQVAEGTADAVLKKKLTTTEQLVADLEKQNKKLQGEIGELNSVKEKVLSEKDAVVVEIKTDHAFDKALQGIKFRSTYSETAASRLVDAAKQEILTKYKPEMVKDAMGGTSIQLRNKATGEIELNPSNLQKPYTPGELLMKNLKGFELIDEGRRQSGTGTNGSQGVGNHVTIDAVRGAKSKPEADAAIKSYLESQKITTSHPDFNQKFQELRREHKVAEMPET